MSDRDRYLLEEALRLPVRQRAQLATQLLRSLDEDPERDLPPDEWEHLWTEEVTRRMCEVQEGKDVLVDGDEAIREVRGLLKPSK